MDEEIITPMYSGDIKDFHWAGLGSGSGTNLVACHKAVPASFIFSNKKTAGLMNLEELADTSRDFISSFLVCGGNRSDAVKKGEEALAEYERKSIEFDELLIDRLKKEEERIGAPFDLIVLGGYMRLVGKTLLEAYKDKIINVHPADLGILKRKEGPPSHQRFKRKYVGDDPVYDAIMAGERYTRSSVMIVDKGVDHGEILTQGPILKISQNIWHMPKDNGSYMVRRYVDGIEGQKGYQDMQKEASDWPALTTALKLIAEGRISLGSEESFFNEWRKVIVDGKAMPYNGLQLK